MVRLKLANHKLHFKKKIHILIKKKKKNLKTFTFVRVRADEILKLQEIVLILEWDTYKIFKMKI